MIMTPQDHNVLSRASTSPSPPPVVPVASTPGVRVAALQKVFAGAVSSTIKTNSYTNFSACFPTPAKYCPTALETVWKQINTRLEENCFREFVVILNERGVVEGLNQWDSIVEEARRRMNRAVEGEDPGRPPHTLSAEELHTIHLTPYLQQAAGTLESRLQSTQRHNTEMMEKINRQKAEIERLISGLEGVVTDIEGSVGAMSAGMGRGVEGLRADIWEMEQEVQATK